MSVASSSLFNPYPLWRNEKKQFFYFSKWMKYHLLDQPISYQILCWIVECVWIRMRSIAVDPQNCLRCILIHQNKISNWRIHRLRQTITYNVQCSQHVHTWISKMGLYALFLALRLIRDVLWVVSIALDNK